MDKWIKIHPADYLEVARWPKGSSGSIKPSPKPDLGRGHFHTHPYASYETPVHRPSDADIYWTKTYGLPGYIVDQESIMSIDPETGKWYDILRR